MSKTLGWLIAGCLVTALFLWRERGHDAETQRLEAQRSAREQVIAVLAARVPEVDTQYVTAKAAVFDKAKRYQRLRDSLFANAESDTITPPVTLAADSAVAACTTAIRTCDNAIALRDVLIAQKDTILWVTDSLLTVEKKRRPDWKSKLGWLLAGAAVGVVLK